MTGQDRVSEGPRIEISKWAIGEIPPYFKKFIEDNGLSFVSALRKGGIQEISKLLRSLSEVLPKDTSFREIASLICVRKNGDLFIACTRGDFERIDSSKTAELFDQLSQEVPFDTDEILVLHDHPSQQSAIGPIPPAEVGFSQEDKTAFTMLGGRLRIADFNKVFLGLVTANSNKVVLLEGKNERRAFGWSFNFEETTEQ